MSPSCSTLVSLAKSPQRRYASARDLADDVERYLASVPLAARPDSLLYRTGKWTRRHPAATLAIALAVLWALTMSWQRHLLRLERDHVASERASAEAALDFLVEVFDGTAPGPDNPERTAAQGVLDRAAARLAEEDTQPALQAKLRQTLGRIYYQIGVFDRAQPLLEQALAGRPAAAESPLEHARLVTQLAELRFRQGRITDAETLHRQALGLRRDADGADHPAVADALNNQGSLTYRAGDLDAAEGLFQRAVEIASAARPPDHPNFAFPLLGLARIALDRRQPDAARVPIERALEIRRAALPADHWRIAEVEALLGEYTLQLGDLNQGRALLQASLTALESVESGSAKRARMRAQLNLGRLCRQERHGCPRLDCD